MIRLYDYWRSSASYRVRIALGLAELTWETVPIDLVAGAQLSPEHLARNPQGLVPVLEIDGLRLTQSLAIVEYLEETRTLGLLPRDPAQRANVRAIAHAVAIDIHPVCNLRVAKDVIARSGGETDMQGWMEAVIGPGLAAVEAMLPGGDFCAGQAPTIADLCLLPQIYNARRWQVDLTPMPKIRRIEEVLERIPAFTAAHPDRTVR